MLRSLLLIAAGALLLAVNPGCKKQIESSGPAAGPSASQNYKCVPIPSGDVKWTYEECGPLVNGKPVDIRQSTVGDVPSGSGFSKETIAKHFPPSKGRLTYTTTNLDWTDYPFPEADVTFVIFMAENNGYMETNWHILGSRAELGGKIWTRLIAQRFDGLCLPMELASCERRDSEHDMPKFDRSRSYKIDCQWDTNAFSGLNDSPVRDGKVQCDYSDVTNPAAETHILTYIVPTGGPYERLNYICVGGGCGPMLFKTSVPTRVTNFRLTLFK